MRVTLISLPYFSLLIYAAHKKVLICFSSVTHEWFICVKFSWWCLTLHIWAHEELNELEKMRKSSLILEWNVSIASFYLFSLFVWIWMKIYERHFCRTLFISTLIIVVIASASFTILIRTSFLSFRRTGLHMCVWANHKWIFMNVW